MTRLLCRGPALDALHSDYAIGGRVDPGALGAVKAAAERVAAGGPTR